MNKGKGKKLPKTEEARTWCCTVNGQKSEITAETLDEAAKACFEGVPEGTPRGVQAGSCDRD